jgi:RNA polymerase sigma-70 factor (ECF subfamily)
MYTTSASLLERLQGPDDPESWQRFVRLYTHLLFYWARAFGAQESDAADLVQDVFTLLVQKLPQFRYDRDKSFRSWLRTVLRNKWVEHQRKAVLAGPLNGPGVLDDIVAADELSAFDEAEYRQYLVRRAMEVMQTEFALRTWKAVWEHVVVGRSAADVAAELGISEGSVYVAKSRVLARLRLELHGLFD